MNNERENTSIGASASRFSATANRPGAGGVSAQKQPALGVTPARQSFWQRTLIPAILGVAAIAVIFMFVEVTSARGVAKQVRAIAADQTAVPTVATIPVRRHSFRYGVELRGTVTNVPTTEARARVSGVMSAVYVKTGTFVRKGYPLFEVQSDALDIAIRSGEALVERLTKQVKNFNRQLEWTTKMEAAGVVNEAAVTDLIAKTNAARGNLGRAREQLAQNLAALDDRVGLAPVDGVVLELPVKAGETISVDQAGAIIQIVQPVSLDFDFRDLPADAAAMVNRFVATSLKNDNTSFEVWIDGESDPRTGHLDAASFNSSSAADSNGVLTVQVATQNADLQHGARAKLNIFDATSGSAVIIPKDAVWRDPNGSAYVWVVDDNDRLTIQVVEVGEEFETGATVADGLSIGDRVVVRRPSVPTVNLAVKSRLVAYTPSWSSDNRDNGGIFLTFEDTKTVASRGGRGRTSEKGEGVEASDGAVLSAAKQ